jgi:hypothetical protein
MNESFDLSKHPERRMGVREVIGVDRYTDFGQVIDMVKSNMARNLAEVIIRESKDFFAERSFTVAGISMLEYRVDCIVVTQRELEEIKREAFKKGMEHAVGFSTHRGLS